MRFLEEKAVYEALVEDWVEEHEGEWVWIHGDAYEFYETRKEALEAAYEELEGKAIFVKKVKMEIEDDAPSKYVDDDDEEEEEELEDEAEEEPVDEVVSLDDDSDDLDDEADDDDDEDEDPKD